MNPSAATQFRKVRFNRHLLLSGVFVALALTSCSTAQLKESGREQLVGTFMLKDVLEMGSGIRLSSDGTYKFFLMVGSVDETDVGKWTKNGNTITLNSTASSINPHYEMVTSSKENFSGVRLVFQEVGKPLASYITNTKLLSNGRTYYMNGSDRGDYQESTAASVPIEKFSLSLLGFFRKYRDFEFTPSNPTHNNFVFRANTGNYGIVRFNNTLLSVGQNEVILKLPHMPREFTYVRTPEPK